MRAGGKAFAHAEHAQVEQAYDPNEQTEADEVQRLTKGPGTGLRHEDFERRPPKPVPETLIQIDKPL